MTWAEFEQADEEWLAEQCTWWIPLEDFPLEDIKSDITAHYNKILTSLRKVATDDYSIS